MIDLSRPLNRHFFPAHGPLNACANAGTAAYPMCESLYCAARRFVGIQYSWRKRLHVSDCGPVRPRAPKYCHYFSLERTFPLCASGR